MKNFYLTGRLAAILGLGLLLAAGCCSQPTINLDSYAHLREEPGEAVRYFQLAVEMGRWQEAAQSLVSDEHEIGSWGIWLASDMQIPEFDNLSLVEILVGTFTIFAIKHEAETAIVHVDSHPKPGITTGIDLYLIKRNNAWVVHLDKTVGINR